MPGWARSFGGGCAARTARLARAPSPRAAGYRSGAVPQPVGARPQEAFRVGADHLHAGMGPPAGWSACPNSGGQGRRPPGAYERRGDRVTPATGSRVWGRSSAGAPCDHGDTAHCLAVRRAFTACAYEIYSSIAEIARLKMGTSRWIIAQTLCKSIPRQSCTSTLRKR
jgi:hypothetical protein